MGPSKLAFDHELDDEDLAEQVSAMAQTLYRRAFWVVGTAVAGLGAVSAIMFYLWRDWKLGYGVHPHFYEAPMAALVGGAIGLGLSMPFGYWFRMQAGLMLVQIKMEKNTRRATEQAAETAEQMKQIAHAGMTGEWSALTDSLDKLSTIGPAGDKEGW
jgi:hypothetical protein